MYKLQQIINCFYRRRLQNFGTRWARQEFQYS